MTADVRLSARAIAVMDDPANSVMVSAVSVWEVAIKFALAREGRGSMPLSGSEFLAELRKVGIEPLGISADHAAAVDQLPLHHHDPFDRLLVAQAQCESMHFLTHDAALEAYSSFVLAV